jgi:hypothetical protein
MFLIRRARLKGQFSFDFQGDAERMIRGVRRFISSNEALGFLSSLISQLIARKRKFEFYAQSKEDEIISRYCPEQYGSYVDIGSGRPISGSNSYFFYKKGWNGLLIDPIKRNEILSKLIRPRDEFKKLLVGQSGFVTFFETYPYEYSTTSQQNFEFLLNLGLVKLKKSTTLKTSPLSSLDLQISELEPSFLSIDAEGADFEVLRSNNWESFKPRVICIESPKDIDVDSKSIVQYLEKYGYSLIEQSQLSKIFVSKRYLESAKVGN